jgi:hypothetical protein
MGKMDFGKINREDLNNQLNKIGSGNYKGNSYNYEFNGDFKHDKNIVY